MQPRQMSVSTIILALLAAFIVALAGFTFWQTRRIEARFPARGHFIDVPGGRLHFTERRPARTRAHVVLIHGASGSEADMIEPLGAALAERDLHVWAFDRPGHGYSDRIGAEDPARQTALIRAALQSLGVERAIIVAHSLGGVVGANFAIEYKDFTSGLVLIAPVTHPWPGGGISWYYKPASQRWTGGVFSHLLAMPLGLALLERAIDAVFAPQRPPSDYLQRTGATLVLRPANFAANARDVAGIYDFVTLQAPRLKEISAPTGIITGDADTIVLTQVHSYGSARDIGAATLKVLAGVGHSPHWVDPQSVVEAIDAVALRAGAAQAARP